MNTLGPGPQKRRVRLWTLSFYGEDRPEVPVEQGRPHGCYEGWVYLGFEGEDESGEPVGVIERVPCRRRTPPKPKVRRTIAAAGA